MTTLQPITSLERVNKKQPNKRKGRPAEALHICNSCGLGL